KRERLPAGRRAKVEAAVACGGSSLSTADSIRAPLKKPSTNFRQSKTGLITYFLGYRRLTSSHFDAANSTRSRAFYSTTRRRPEKTKQSWRVSGGLSALGGR